MKKKIKIIAICLVAVVIIGSLSVLLLNNGAPEINGSNSAGDSKKSFALLNSTAYGGMGNGTFSKLASAGLESLEQSTLLGKVGLMGIAIDNSGDVLVAGQTINGWVKPVDAVIMKLSPDLTILKARTLFGGPGVESVHSLLVGKDNNVHFTGETYPDYVPADNMVEHANATPGAYSNVLGGECEGYIAEFDSGLTNLIACTLIGGSSYDIPCSICQDWDGSIWVSGITHSNNFPVSADAPDATYSSQTDSFLCHFSSNLTMLRFVTYLGVSGSVNSMSIGSDGNVVLAFMATSGKVTTADALSRSFG